MSRRWVFAGGLFEYVMHFFILLGEGVSRRYLERPLGEYDPLDVRPTNVSKNLPRRLFSLKTLTFLNKTLGRLSLSGSP